MSNGIQVCEICDHEVPCEHFPSALPFQWVEMSIPRSDLTLALGWMAAREAAAGVAEDMNPDIWDYHTGNRSRFADDPVARAIRALPAPTSAQLLAEAMKLPEVAALVDAHKEIIRQFGDTPNGHMAATISQSALAAHKEASP